MEKRIDLEEREARSVGYYEATGDIPSLGILAGGYIYVDGDPHTKEKILVCWYDEEVHLCRWSEDGDILVDLQRCAKAPANAQCLCGVLCVRRIIAL